MTFTPTTEDDYLDDGTLAPSQVQYQAVYYGEFAGEGYDFGGVGGEGYDFSEAGKGKGGESPTASLAWDDTQGLTAASAQGSRRRLLDGRDDDGAPPPEAGVATRRLAAEENDDSEKGNDSSNKPGET